MFEVFCGFGLVLVWSGLFGWGWFGRSECRAMHRSGRFFVLFLFSLSVDGLESWKG